MDPIKLPEQIASLEKIIKNSTNCISFLDVVGLVFHGISLLSQSDDGCKNIYSEFLEGSDKQHKNRWPELIIIKNDYSKRVDVMSNKSFIASKNLLVLLQRMLYIETQKEKYVYSTYNYYPILPYIINKNIDVKKLSLDDVFDLCKECMVYYTKIYNDDGKFENILARNILKQLD